MKLSDTNLRENLNSLLKNHNITLLDVCKYLHINYKSFTNSFYTDTLPKLDSIIPLSKYFNVSVDYLLGSGGDVLESIHLTPFFDQKLSAGPGQEPIDLDEVKKYPVPCNMIKHYDKRLLRCAEVRGDSMKEENLCNGDIAVFQSKLIEGNGIYVLSINGNFFVKRLDFNPLTKKVTVISANKNYQSYEVSIEDEGLIIHGKVIGWIHQNLE